MITESRKARKRNNYIKLQLFILLSIVLICKTYSQEIENNGRISLGLNYGQAAQDKFPYDNPDYLYQNQYFKIQLNYLLSKKKRFRFEFHAEPSLYLSEHQLLNKYFIKPEDNPDFLIERKRFTQRRTFNEYALHMGIIIRYELLNDFSTYLLGSTGPMYSGEDTERLKQGFAFSNIFGLGFSYKEKKVLFDIRLTIRHSSNLELSQPNHGHDSTGIEFGISHEL